MRVGFIGLCLILLTGCASHEKSETRPPLAKTSAAMPVVYAGEAIKISMRVDRKDLLTAKNADVTLENAVPQISDETWLSSVKTSVPLRFDGAETRFEFPTTADFRPGVWHVKEIEFAVSPGPKGKVTLTEGKDYTGLPFNLLNAQKMPTGEAVIELETVESVPQ